MHDFSRCAQGSNSTSIIGDRCELFAVILCLEFGSFLLSGGDGIPGWALGYCDSWDSLEDVEPRFISFHYCTSTHALPLNHSLSI